MRNLNGVETGFDDPKIALIPDVTGDIDERVERKLRDMFGDEHARDCLQMKHMIRTGLVHARWDDQRDDAVFWVDEATAAMFKEAKRGEGGS